MTRAKPPPSEAVNLPASPCPTLGSCISDTPSAAQPSHRRPERVVATHGRSGIARFRLGSVADKIIRQSPAPVLVIGPNVDVELAPYALKRVLVPLDGEELAEQALPIAAWIARLARTPLGQKRARQPVHRVRVPGA